MVEEQANKELTSSHSDDHEYSRIWSLKRIVSLSQSGLQKLCRKKYPPIPTDQKFLISIIYQEAYCDSKFLIYNKRKSYYNSRLLIIASDEQLKVLFNSEVLFADGTFKVSLILFEQLYVLHGL